MRPSKVGDAVIPLRPWMTSWPLSHGLASRACLTNLSWGLCAFWIHG